jgi:hypothetical protein
MDLLTEVFDQMNEMFSLSNNQKEEAIPTQDFIRIIQELPDQTFYFTEEGWSHTQEYQEDFGKFILIYKGKAWAQDGDADTEVLEVEIQYPGGVVKPNSTQAATLKELIESKSYVEIM